MVTTKYGMVLLGDGIKGTNGGSIFIDQSMEFVMLELARASLHMF